MKKKTERLRKSIKKLLNKKLFVKTFLEYVLIIMAVIMSIDIITISTAPKYDYVDIYGNRGKSTKCYEKHDKFYCNTDVQVEYYSW